MQTLRIRIKKGEGVPGDLICSIQSKLMDACHQFGDMDGGQEPATMDFLTGDAPNIEEMKADVYLCLPR